MVCAYSVRAKDRPTVSTPVTWDEDEQPPTLIRALPEDGEQRHSGVFVDLRPRPEKLHKEPDQRSAALCKTSFLPGGSRRERVDCDAQRGCLLGELYPRSHRDERGSSGCLLPASDESSSCVILATLDLGAPRWRDGRDLGARVLEFAHHADQAGRPGPPPP
jgi:hypothetical protein